MVQRTSCLEDGIQSTTAVLVMDYQTEDMAGESVCCEDRPYQEILLYHKRWCGKREETKWLHGLSKFSGLHESKPVRGQNAKAR